jgi:hypothetical protein
METTTGRSWILPADWLGRSQNCFGCFGTGPNGHRVGDHLFTEKVHRCAVRKKQNQGWMDGV